MFTSFLKMSDNEHEVEKLKEENQQLKDELRNYKHQLEIFQPYYEEYQKLKVDTWIEKQELLKLIKRLSK